MSGDFWAVRLTQLKSRRLLGLVLTKSGLARIKRKEIPLRICWLVERLGPLRRFLRFRLTQILAWEDLQRSVPFWRGPSLGAFEGDRWSYGVDGASHQYCHPHMKRSLRFLLLPVSYSTLPDRQYKPDYRLQGGSLMVASHNASRCRICWSSPRVQSGQKWPLFLAQPGFRIVSGFF